MIKILAVTMAVLSSLFVAPKSTTTTTTTKASTMGNTVVYTITSNPQQLNLQGGGSVINNGSVAVTVGDNEYASPNDIILNPGGTLPWSGQCWVSVPVGQSGSVYTVGVPLPFSNPIYPKLQAFQVSNISQPQPLIPAPPPGYANYIFGVDFTITNATGSAFVNLEEGVNGNVFSTLSATTTITTDHKVFNPPFQTTSAIAAPNTEASGAVAETVIQYAVAPLA